MRRAGTLISGLAGFVLLGLFLSAARGYLEPDFGGEPDAMAALPAEPQAPASPVIETRSVRPIRPELFVSPFARDATSLERIAPREPYSGDEADKERVKVVLLPRPQSPEAGILTFSGRELRLRHLVPTSLGRQCADDTGTEWPCGVVARTQQRRFLRNRAVTCEGETTDWAGVFVTACRVGNADIAEWLVRNGWADAEKGSPLEGFAQAARSERLGIFGDDPR